MLERLGLSECATAGIDSVPVRGYSVFKTDGTELPLSYPARDPRDTMSFLGMSQFNPVTAEHTAGSDAQPAVDGSLPPPVLPTDGRPLGRSFHNTRFVDNLRKAAAAEPTVLVRCVWRWRYARPLMLCSATATHLMSVPHTHRSCKRVLRASW